MAAAMKDRVAIFESIARIITGKNDEGPRRCEAVATFAIENYRIALMRRLEANGGILRADDLDRVMQELAVAPELARRAHGACISAMTRGPRSSPSADPFERLLAETFSQLVVPDEEGRGPGIRHTHIRRFLEVLGVMLGEETVATRRNACDAIFRELGSAHPADAVWERFRADHRSQEILVQTVLDIIDHFKDFPRRTEWLIRFMNSGPKTGQPVDPSQHTYFSQAEFIAMAQALVASIDNDGNRAMTGRHTEAVAQFRSDLDRFAATVDARS